MADEETAMGGDLPKQQGLLMSSLTRTQKKRLLDTMRADEWMQSIGITNLVATTVVVFRFPQAYWLLHIVKSFIYLPWRFVRFRRLDSELYLLDFCYMATYVTIVSLFLSYLRVALDFSTPLQPYNGVLLRAGFTFGSGALAWSILIFRNSLVFHSIDHITSFFIHFSPAALFWCLRWGAGWGVALIDEALPGMFDTCPGVSENGEQADACLEGWRVLGWCSSCAAPWQDFVLYPAILYIVLWAIPYYLLIFCILRGWIERNNKETLFVHVLSDPTMSKFVKMFPEPLWPFAYLLQHFATVIGFGSLTYIFWHSFPVHTAFLSCMLLVAIRNGSTYTFRVFSLRYAEAQLESRPSILNDGAPKYQELDQSKASPRGGE